MLLRVETMEGQMETIMYSILVAVVMLAGLGTGMVCCYFAHRYWGPKWIQ